jgi:hypothetical protein
MKAVLVQADPMQSDREDGGKGLVLVDDSGLMLVWGVGVLFLSCTSSGDAARPVKQCSRVLNLKHISFIVTDRYGVLHG